MSAPAPAFLRNPYVIGSPITDPNLLFGRQDIFDFLTDNLSSGAKVVLLQGQRRIGKSSVLALIPHFVHLDDFVFVLFDLQDQARLPLGEVLHHLAGTIVHRLGLPIEEATFPTFTQLKENPDLFAEEFLPRVYEAVPGKNLVLLLDEFDVLQDYRPDEAVESFFPYLVRTVNRQAKFFVIPVVGRRPDELDKLLSLFHEAPSKRIGRLTTENARLQITGPAVGILEYDDAAIQAIVRLSSGHPYFTQLLCNVLFDALRQERRAWVTAEDVERVVPTALERGSGGLAWFYDGLPIPERVVLSAVAEAQGPPLPNTERHGTTVVLDRGPNAIREFLKESFEKNGIVWTTTLLEAGQRLVDWGYLERPPRLPSMSWAKNHHTVPVELVRRWLLGFHPLAEARLELEQADPEANRLYLSADEARKSADLFKAIDLYEQALRLNPNHFLALAESGNVLVELEEHDKALICYRRAYIVYPLLTRDGYIRALNKSGIALLKRFDLRAAAERFATVLELEPTDQAARQFLLRATRSGQAPPVQNPFTFGTPVSPDQFVGREREIGALLDQIQNSGHAALYGENGVGKTSLLWLLQSGKPWRGRGAEPSRKIFVYMNCGEANAPSSSPALFWEGVLNEFKDQVKNEPELLALADNATATSGNSRAGIDNFFRAVAEHGRSLVLLLDDIDALLESIPSDASSEFVAFVYVLIALGNSGLRNGRGHSFILASRRPLSEWAPQTYTGSPWWNAYLFLPLRPFDQGETSQLLAKMPGEFAPSGLELGWVHRVAGGYPYLLQAALSTLFRIHADDRPFNFKEVTKEFADMVSPFFEGTGHYLSNIDKGLLTLVSIENLPHLIAEAAGTDFGEDIRSILSQRVRELRRLEDLGLLLSGKARGNISYRLISSVLEWWILKEVESLPEAEIEGELEDIFKLSKRMKERLRAFLRNLRKRQAVARNVELWGDPLERS